MKTTRPFLTTSNFYPRIFFILFSIFLFLNGCSQEKKSENNPDSSKVLLAQRFENHLNVISSFYKKQEPEGHLLETSKALWTIQNTSIRALLPQIDSLNRFVKKEGLKPYVSLVLAISHRLARNNHKIYQKKFDELANVSLFNKNDQTDPEKPFWFLIKKKGDNRNYLKLNLKAGYAISQLAMSKFGKAQYKKGQWPVDMIRTTAMLWLCNEDKENIRHLSAAGLKNCDFFTKIVEGPLDQAAQGQVTPSLYEGIKSGVSFSAFDCFNKDNKASQMIDAMEAYAACISSQASEFPNDQSWLFEGTGIKRDWTGPVPIEDGYEMKGPSQEEVFYGPNGNVGTQVTHEYVNNEGGSKTITDYATIINGQEDVGRRIQEDDGNGNTYIERQDRNGNKIFSFRQNSDESSQSYEVNEEGVGVTVTVGPADENGERNVTVQKDDGSDPDTGKLDSNGNCYTGSACGVLTPVDYPQISRCNPPWQQRPEIDDSLETDPLGPYIYPSPDDTDENELLECIRASLSPESDTDCPPSVMECLEPPPPNSCDCGAASTPQEIAVQSAACLNINCGEGSQCDPATGVCISLGLDDGSFGRHPGILPPISIPFNDKIPFSNSDLDQ